MPLIRKWHTPLQRVPVAVIGPCRCFSPAGFLTRDETEIRHQRPTESLEVMHRWHEDPGTCEGAHSEPGHVWATARMASRP